MSRNGAERIRPATPGDLDALAQLERQGFSPPWSRASLADELVKSTRRTWLLEAERAVLAYACFQCLAGEAELLRIAVHTAHRGTGFGHRLLHYGLQRLKRDGVTVCHLEVRADNRAALALYRRHGFVEAGRRRGYYADGMDALLLKVWLAPLVRNRARTSVDVLDSK